MNYNCKEIIIESNGINEELQELYSELYELNIVDENLNIINYEYIPLEFHNITNLNEEKNNINDEK